MNITIEIAARFTGTLTIKDVCTIEVTPTEKPEPIEIMGRYSTNAADIKAKDAF